MSSPDLTEAEFTAVRNVLATRYLSIGPQADALEKALAAYVGTAHAATVSSGTAGLHLCVVAAGIGEGDLVITTPFSFVASANCVLYERAVPVFVDVDPLTGNVDPELVGACADALADGGEGARDWLPPALRGRAPRGSLKALLPVHAFGQPADMDPLTAVARRHGLTVIEDACEAIGAEYKGRKAGTLGDAGVFAWYPNKQMTTGEGGAIVTDRGEFDVLFRSLRNQGRDVFDAWLRHSRLGYNYRLDEMSAALGLVQLRRLEELLDRRARVARWYDERLSGHELVETPRVGPATTRMSWFVYVVRINRPARRDAVLELLGRRGIPSRPYFTPIHLQPLYAERFGHRAGDFPVTEGLGEVSLALPFSSVMTEGQVDEVCRHLAAVAVAPAAR